MMLPIFLTSCARARASGAIATRWFGRAHLDLPRAARRIRARGGARGRGGGAAGRVAVLDKNTSGSSTVLSARRWTRGDARRELGLAPPEMEYILDHSQARVLFVGEEFLATSRR